MIVLSVTFRRVQVWHEDVEAYAAHDAHDGELQGYFFLDLHPRPGKYAHQCVYPLQPAFGAAADGTRTPAVCTVIGNMTKPTAERPALMRFREVETFFHEFGHVMHWCGATLRLTARVA